MISPCAKPLVCRPDEDDNQYAKPLVCSLRIDFICLDINFYF